MSKLASIYVWLLVGAIFIFINIWILNGFESRILYAKQQNEVNLGRTLKEALGIARKMEKKSQKFDLATLKLARDPFSFRASSGSSRGFVYSREKKFFKRANVALKLPSIDGLITIKKMDGTELKYLLVKGRMLKLGDSVDNFKFVDIRQDSVIVESGGKEFKIAFSKNKYNLVAARSGKLKQENEAVDPPIEN